ncbi:MAG TPA: geranylgeranylglycerol-phosphate geranylgeranyltransferase [Gemmatimonadales bacterium]|jgi:4-hydroxybenzoate polyprenyltransferase|nr:geranylgeranylglycerol-phosphate geranylgeranyltransferase [Gemmatimonadales bacterium]
MAVVRLVRGPNLLIAAAGVLAGGWIALGTVAVPNLLLFAALSGIGLGAAGNAWNDICDAAADRVNRPAGDRPLAAGRVRRGTADLLVFLGALAGLGAAGLVSGRQVLVGLGALAVMLAYSPLIKPRPVIGNVAVALVAGLPPFYGALAVGRPAAGVVPWALAAWLHLAREIVKDVEDEPGDRAIGRRTLPIVSGRRPAQVVAAGVGLLFVPASLLLPRAAGFGPAYFLIALPAQMAVLVAATWLILGRVERVSVLLKSAMVVGLLALVAGKVA